MTHDVGMGLLMRLHITGTVQSTEPDVEHAERERTSVDANLHGGGWTPASASWVAKGDKQVRVRWGNWLLPEARVPRVNEQSRRVDDSTLKERHRAVFPLPTDASIEHTKLGSREVRRMS